MTRPFAESDELRTLLDAVCEERITPDQLRRLEHLVLTHPEAEAYYVQYMSLSADLARHFAAPGRSRSTDPAPWERAAQDPPAPTTPAPATREQRPGRRQLGEAPGQLGLERAEGLIRVPGRGHGGWLV